jgi:hypothetical protein
VRCVLLCSPVVERSGRCFLPSSDRLGLGWWCQIQLLTPEYHRRTDFLSTIATRLVGCWVEVAGGEDFFLLRNHLPTCLPTLRKGFIAIVSMAFGRDRSVSWSAQTTHGNEMILGDMEMLVNGGFRGWLVGWVGSCLFRFFSLPLSLPPSGEVRPGQVLLLLTAATMITTTTTTPALSLSFFFP